MTDGSAVRASVIMPVLNEERAIGESLSRVLAQTVEDIEVIVADGRSNDETREVVTRLRDPRIRLVDNPRGLQSAGLNMALTTATSDVIVRLDARSFVEPDYVERCLAVLEATGAAVVGGRMVAQPERSAMARGIAVANEAWWGAGPARFHRGGAAGPADTVYLGAFRRSWIEKEGGWAEDVGVNEDFELNHRIRKSGGIVWFDPTLEVGYRPRADLAALARQYFRYGRSKATVLRRHPESVRLRQVLPGLMILVGLLACTPTPTRGLARATVAAHVGTLTVLAGHERTPGAVRLGAGAAAWIMHWTWSAGFWFGVLRPFPPAGTR